MKFGIDVNGRGRLVVGVMGATGNEPMAQILKMIGESLDREHVKTADVINITKIHD